MIEFLNIVPETASTDFCIFVSTNPAYLMSISSPISFPFRNAILFRTPSTSRKIMFTGESIFAISFFSFLFIFIYPICRISAGREKFCGQPANGKSKKCTSRFEKLKTRGAAFLSIFLCNRKIRKCIKLCSKLFNHFC